VLFSRPESFFVIYFYIGVFMSEIDLAPLQKILSPYIPLGRSGLLPALHAAQKHYGWLSQPVTAEVGNALKVPLADVHGVIEFYSLFYNEPVGNEATTQPVPPEVDVILHDPNICNDTRLKIIFYIQLVQKSDLIRVIVNNPGKQINITA